MRALLQNPGFLFSLSSSLLEYTFEWDGVLLIQTTLLTMTRVFMNLDYLLSEKSQDAYQSSLISQHPDRQSQVRAQYNTCKAGLLVEEQPRGESSLAAPDYRKGVCCTDRLGRLPQPTGQQLSNELHEISDVMKSRAKEFPLLNHWALESIKVHSLQGPNTSTCQVRGR